MTLGLGIAIGLAFLVLLVGAEMMRSNGPRWPAWGADIMARLLLDLVPETA